MSDLSESVAELVRMLRDRDIQIRDLKTENFDLRRSLDAAKSRKPKFSESEALAAIKYARKDLLGAIKVMRDLTDLGLKEAKEAVEAAGLFK